MRNIVILLLVVMAWGCGAGHDSRLERADALACTDPAKAIDILDSIDTSALSEADRAWYGLLRAKARDKNHEAVGCEPLTEFAAEYYAGRGDSLEIQALYYHGVGLADADSASQAIIALREAYDKAVKGGDHFYAAMAARALGEVFNAQMIPDRQLAWAERAKEQFGKAGKPVHAAWMDLDIADALIYCGRYEEAEKALDALDREEYESSKPFRKRALRHRLALYAFTGRHEELTATYDSLKQSGTPIRAYDYYNIADSYIKRGEPERAAQYRDSVAKQAKTLSDSLCLYHLDSRLMRNGGDREKMVRSIEAFADEMMLLSEKAVMHPETLILADNYSLKADLVAERAEKERERIAWMSIGAALLIVAAVFGMLYMRTRLRIRRLEAARLREDLSRSESRTAALETDVANLTEQIAGYRRKLEQKEEQIAAINHEKGAIEQIMDRAEEEYRDRIKALEGEYHELEKEYESVKSSSTDMSFRIEKILMLQQELKEEYGRQEADYRGQIDALMASKSSIEQERDELRKICEKMAVMEKIIGRLNAGEMPERARTECKPLFEHDRLMSETVYSLFRMDGSIVAPKVAQTVDEAINKLKDREYLEKYVRAVDIMNHNWLKDIFTELDMKPAEIELIKYLYIGLTPEVIAQLMEKKNALNVNTAKSKLRKRLLNMAPERRHEFCRNLNMRKGR